MSSIAIQHRAEIIERIAAGNRITDIAASLGITQPAISNIIRRDPEFLYAKELGLEVTLDRWEREIEQIGPDSPAVMLARAERGLNQARWRAEREAPHRWGAKQQVQVSHQHSVDDRLQASLDKLLGRVVEGQHSVSHDVSHNGDNEGTGVMSNTPALQHVAPAPLSLDSLDALIVEDEPSTA